MNKRRLTVMLALPMILGVLLGGVKWKQMHPTATQLDLQERAILSKAVKVEIWNPTYRGQVPVAEFKDALNDLYLIEDEASRTNSTATVTPPGQIVFAVMLNSSDDTSKSVAMIGVSPLGYYASFRDSDPKRLQFVRSLHPVTQRRLKKLVEENMSAY